MAEADAPVDSGSQGTWGISQPVRRFLSRTVLALRRELEDDYRKQLRAVGVREDGIQPLAAGRTLALEEQRVRDMAQAVINRELESGATDREAFNIFVRDSAFTFFNRLVAFRCLDERRVLVVDGLPETVIKVDPASNSSTLYWRVRNQLGANAAPRDVWREVLTRASAAISERVRVLFDQDSEYAALFPLQATVLSIVTALNTPEIPADTYALDEVLGWIYQYYNADEKDAAYAALSKGEKLERPDQLIAATCLYTERYMVDYLLQNTLGLLWMEMHPDSKLFEHWPYFVRPTDETPLIKREARRLRDITLMDPACGGCHFLLRAFDLLVEMYREEGVEPESEIPHLILERNLHGIDIDLRAIQIGAFGLYLKACSLAGPDFQPRQLNLVAADAVLAGDEPAPEYMDRFKDDPQAQELIKTIWQGLKNVREIGSLLHPEKAIDELIARRKAADKGGFFDRGESAWEAWKRELLHGLKEEFERQAKSEDLGQRLFGADAAKGVGLVEAFAGSHDAVVANPPYMGSANMSERLKAFVSQQYPAGKPDLYAAFMLRSLELVKAAGYVGMVTQQSWMFSQSFRALRSRQSADGHPCGLLNETVISSIAHLGTGAFAEIAGVLVNTALVTLQQRSPGVSADVTVYDLRLTSGDRQKAIALAQCARGIGSMDTVFVRLQSSFRDTPNGAVLYSLPESMGIALQSKVTAGDYLSSVNGSRTGDNARYLRFFWEVDPTDVGNRWRVYAKGGSPSRWIGNEEVLVDWSDEAVSHYRDSAIGRCTEERYWEQEGLSFSKISRGNLTVRHVASGISDYGGPVLRADDPETLLCLVSVLNTRYAAFCMFAFNPSNNTEIGDIYQLPVGGLIETESALLAQGARACIEAKLRLLSSQLTSFRFCVGQARGRTLLQDADARLSDDLWVGLVLALWQGTIEAAVVHGLGLAWDEFLRVGAGTPAAWYPRVQGFTDVPETRAGMSSIPLPNMENFGGWGADSTVALLETQKRLRMILVDSLPMADDAGTSDPTDGSESPGSSAPKAELPIPSESLVERVSQVLKAHPVSIYGLMQELRHIDGELNSGLLKPRLEQGISARILTLLGYVWPGESKGDWPQALSLRTDDGVLPLTRCGNSPAALDRLRALLETEFGIMAETADDEFQATVGCGIEAWLSRNFFRNHIQHFNRRPVAWHLVSPERTFEAFVLQHKLSGATLQRLRAQYAGGLITQLRSEQDQARTRGASSDVSALQAKIEDVEEFRLRIEKIERGDDLKYRIRCPWKGEENIGRPGPYAPDVNDGVKVNIRPFQEAGLLAVKDVIKKW